MERKEQRIKRMRSKLNILTENIAKMKGEQEGLLKQLKNEGCSSTEEAKKEIKKEEKKVEKLQLQLNKELKSLEEDYDWE